MSGINDTLFEFSNGGGERMSFDGKDSLSSREGGISDLNYQHRLNDRAGG